MIPLPPCPGSDARFFSLSGLRPANPARPRPDQASDLFEQFHSALEQEGMTFAHVVRTWFFLDSILDWYDVFNGVRNAFFRQHRVFGGIMPASTGVGLAGLPGVAVVGGLLAVRPAPATPPVIAVPSPLQCPSLDYGSAFSRAVEVQMAGQRHLYISGTASIDRDGRSLHQGDCDAQIGRTMDVVAAILAARRMKWTDTTRAIGYFRSADDMPRLAAYLGARGLAGLPVTPVQATICRDELLFELELDACSSQPLRD